MKLKIYFSAVYILIICILGTIIVYKKQGQIEKFFLERHSWDYPPENEGWVKLSGNPIYGDKSTGTIFDPFAYVDNGAVFISASERKTGSIILLSYQNHKCTRLSTQLTGRQGTWESIVNRSCIIKKDNGYKMWYTGQDGNQSCIGYAESTDGRVFHRIGSEPIIRPDLEPEKSATMNPSVIWDEEEAIYKIWYAAGENYEPDVIMYATSSDGIHWEKRDLPVLTATISNTWECNKVGGPQVIKRGKNDYIMYYIGYQNVHVARICCAHSTDGVTWERNNHNLLLSPTKGAWDENACYKPTVIDLEGVLKMFYNGRQENCEYIGEAEYKHNL